MLIELPASTVGDTVSAITSDGLCLRSLQIDQQPLNAEEIAAKQNLQDRIQETNDRLITISNQLEVIKEVLSELKTARVILTNRSSKNAFDVEIRDIIELVKYSSEQKTKLLKQQHELQTEYEALDELSFELLEREEDLEISHASRPLRATLLLTQRQPSPNRSTDKLKPETPLGNGAEIEADESPIRESVTLRYEVEDCGWVQRYELRATKGSNTSDLISRAYVKQSTLENWTDVELTLATSSPSGFANGPPLIPMKILAETKGTNDGSETDFGGSLHRAKGAIQCRSDC